MRDIYSIGVSLAVSEIQRESLADGTVRLSAGNLIRICGDADEFERMIAEEVLDFRI